MKTYTLDADVCLRFLLADDPGQSPRARELFEKAERGGLRLKLSHVALAELGWVLTSFYELPRTVVGERLRGLALHDGVEINEQAVILGALDRFSRVNADFPDCYAAALAGETGAPVVTYDRDFRKFPEAKAQTPDEVLI